MFYCLLLCLLIGKVWAALLTISHHLQKSLDVGMKSFIVQPDFSAAFERVSHNGILFKLNSIGVGGSVLSICSDFLSDRRQKVVVDGAASKWIPIISLVTGKYVADKHFAMQMILHNWLLFTGA